MTIRQIARLALREGTAGWHERVDAVFSIADLTDRDAYGRFLRGQAAAHLPVEQALEEGGIADVIADWPLRRRADLIRADLAALDLAIPPLEPQMAFSNRAALLGGAYVFEGSRLGGAMLKRAVPAELPAAFLSAGTSAAWRDLITLLDVALTTKEDIDRAIAAACDVFALFERSGRRFLEGPILAG